LCFMIARLLWVSISVMCSLLPDLRFFFFQAEDGIRDKLVTGVQTCALPISMTNERCPPFPFGIYGFREDGALELARGAIDSRQRSEERRVGKECMTRWSRND